MKNEKEKRFYGKKTRTYKFYDKDFKALGVDGFVMFLSIEKDEDNNRYVEVTTMLEEEQRGVIKR